MRLRGPHGDHKGARSCCAAGAACAGPAAGRAPRIEAADPQTTSVANAVPVALLKDRDNVWQLQVQNKLIGVPLYDDEGHCRPLLAMKKDLSWMEALDEYAVGLCGRPSIREVE